MEFVDDLRRHALTLPEKLALTTADGATHRTYAELDASADAIARWFRSIGLDTGDTIALLLENRVEVVEIWWAARRMGLYYAPLSTHFREGEILHVLRDSNVRLLITSAGFHDIIVDVVGQLGREERPKCVMLDHSANGFDVFEPTLWTTLPAVFPAALYGRDLIYSSGTTGRPRGVRRPLMACAGPDDLPYFERVVRDLFKVQEPMVYLSTSPLYHSIARFLMRTTEAGGTGVILPAFEPEAALATIERFQVTHTLWVPTMFVRMLALPEAVRRRYDVSSLDLALHAAAPCPVPVKHAMIEWFGEIVEEFYGGTENAGVTYLNAAEWLERPGSVGRSLVGGVHILAEDGSEDELAAGEIGVIYFDSTAPFTYQNDDSKSHAAFTSRGWGTYGDIGHLDADGYLYLSDRRTDLIISGGVNIYPSEVENLLALHPAVAEVAVVGVPEPEFGQQVIAVVRLSAGFDAEDGLAVALKTWSRERLAPLKCPREIHFTDALPKNEHGKLLKRVLRDQYSAPTSNDQ